MSKGQISVHTENLLPIIKKWLYSDKDIFLRELVSNAQDAIMKMKKLESLGNAKLSDGEKFEIKVELNKENGTIKVSDNGIGMTYDEVEKYINQVAFSGAEEFIKQYEKENDEKSRIIGHFGLGFYSAFMAAEKVEIDTLSYMDGAKGVHWESDGGSEYDMSDCEKGERGTTITLHIADDSKEYLEYSTVKGVLDKYCRFLPVEIYLVDVSNTEEKELSPINDTNPLWLNSPKDCTDEQYKDFYKKVFFDFKEPLFYIHLNVDFPFNLKGILYFPKLNHELQSVEGQIKLYNNQVFIADNIKEVIPEYLMLLKGVIDCPDLPLNVSRSFLQNDGYVKKVSNHIVKKVCDKLCDIYKNDLESYKKYWEDINPFVKYGCIRDDSFYDRVKDVLLFKKLDSSYISLKEIVDSGQKEVYYVTDIDAQAQYIELLKSENIEMVILDSMIDNHFVSYLEYKMREVKFKRVDSYISESLKADENDNELCNKIVEAFKGIAGENVVVETSALKSDKISAIFVLSEEARRMQEMSAMFGNMGMNMPNLEEKLVVNSINPLVKKAAMMEESDTKQLVLKQIYDIAMLSHKKLSGDDLSSFIERSNSIMEKLLD